MPFESQAQRGFMYAKHPKIAKRFEEETPDDSKLPQHVKKMNQGGFPEDWKNDLAGYMDEHFGENQGQDQPQQMADGGLAGNYDVNLGDTSTARGIPNAPYSGVAGSLTKDDLFGPPPPFFPQTPAPASGPVFNPKISLPTEHATAAVPVAPTGPDPELQGYLDQFKRDLNKYGPDEQMALEQSIQKQRRGLIPNLALAGTGFADAIMQGVAGAGPSNFQSNLQNRMDKTQEGQIKAFENARTGNLAKMKQEMELAQMDPASILSKSTQRANLRTLKGLGYSDADISQIPASTMPEALTKRLTLEEIKQKQALAMATLGMTATIQGQTQKLATAKERREQIIEAAKNDMKNLNQYDPRDRDQYLKSKAVLERVARGEDVSQGGAGAQPIYVVNPQTKHRMVSHDGGLTWGEVQ